MPREGGAEALISHLKLQSSWIVFLDLGCLLTSILLAVMLRFGHEEVVLYVWQRLDGWVLFVGSLLIANYMAGSYRVQYTLSRFDLLVTWIFSITFAMFILSVTSYAWFKVLLGRGVLALAAVLYSALSLYLRIIVVRAVFSAGRMAKRIVILGHATADRRLRDYLENPFLLPRNRVVAWVSLCGPSQRLPAKGGVVLDRVPVVEATVDELPDVLRSLDADLLVLGRAAMWELSSLYTRLRQVRFSGIEVMTPLGVTEVYGGRLSLELLDETETMHFGVDGGFPVMFRLKRVLDMAISVIGGLLTLPLMLVTALLIKLTEPRSPVLYSQERVGQFGRVFRIRKFRTMRADAEAQSGAVWSSDRDPRITPLGRILRKFRVDELPQFWNVLVGEMSLVGPRPERPEITALLDRQIPFYSEREVALPGVSGWAQIHYPYGNTVEAARRKLEYDLYYIKNMSPSLDLQIVLRTLRTVLFGKEKEQ